MKVAYQGVAGAFSHQAALSFAPDHEPIARPTFAAVIEAVEAGEAQLGILPVENSRAGPVPEVKTLLAQNRLSILSRHPLAVRMHLLGLRGSRIEDIRTAVSHPMALEQSAQTLRSMGLAMEPAANTAIAAQTLSDPTKGVLASEWAAQAYGLDILVRDVHDDPNNTTHFVLLTSARG